MISRQPDVLFPRSLSDDAAHDDAGTGAAWRRLLAFDLAVLIFVQRWERRAVTRLMRALTDLGNPANWLLLAAVLATTGGEGPRCAALLGAAALIGLTASQLLKRTCRRPRPSELAAGTDAAAGTADGRNELARVRALAADPDAFSFPSGHTTVAFAVAVALAGSASGLGAVVAVLAGGIAVSRVYLGAHYPLDVAAGALLGAASGWVARLLLTAAF